MPAVIKLRPSVIKTQTFFQVSKFHIFFFLFPTQWYPSCFHQTVRPHTGSAWVLILWHNTRMLHCLLDKQGCESVVRKEAAYWPGQSPLPIAAIVIPTSWVASVSLLKMKVDLKVLSCIFGDSPLTCRISFYGFPFTNVTPTKKKEEKTQTKQQKIHQMLGLNRLTMFDL